MPRRVLMAVNVLVTASTSRAAPRRQAKGVPADIATHVPMAASVRARAASTSHAGSRQAATGAATSAQVTIAAQTAIQRAIVAVAAIAVRAAFAVVPAGRLPAPHKAADGIVSVHPMRAASRKALIAR